MKKLTYILTVSSLIALIGYTMSCKPSALISAKSGAQIWGETCLKCHNVASPETFSDAEWDVAAMHMQMRANLTPDETKKVTEFLQSAN